MKPTEFDLWDDTLVVFVRKSGMVSPTGLAMRAMNSPALDFIRREKDGGDCLIHLRDKDCNELVYRITQDDAQMLSAADELGTYRFEFEPERSRVRSAHPCPSQERAYGATVSAEDS